MRGPLVIAASVTIHQSKMLRMLGDLKILKRSRTQSRQGRKANAKKSMVLTQNSKKCSICLKWSIKAWMQKLTTLTRLWWHNKQQDLVLSQKKNKESKKCWLSSKLFQPRLRTNSRPTPQRLMELLDESPISLKPSRSLRQRLTALTRFSRKG